MKFRPFSETKYVWIIILILTIIAIVFKSVYRHYIYTNQINDFGIADSSPNFFAGLIIVFTYYIQPQKLTLRKYALFSLIGLIGYELVQGSIFKTNIFDFKDLIFSIIGTLLGYLFCIKLSSSSILGFQNTAGSNEIT